MLLAGEEETYECTGDEALDDEKKLVIRFDG